MDNIKQSTCKTNYVNYRWLTVNRIGQREDPVYYLQNTHFAINALNFPTSRTTPLHPWYSLCSETSQIITTQRKYQQMYTQLPRKIDFRHFEVITRSKRRKQSIQDVEDNRQRGQRCTVKNLGEIFKDMAPGGAARGRETRVFLNYRIRQGSRSLLLLARPGIPDRKSN